MLQPLRAKLSCRVAEFSLQQINNIRDAQYWFSLKSYLICNLWLKRVVSPYCLLPRLREKRLREYLHEYLKVWLPITQCKFGLKVDLRCRLVIILNPPLIWRTCNWKNSVSDNEPHCINSYCNTLRNCMPRNYLLQITYILISTMLWCQTLQHSSNQRQKAEI